jgi:Mg2+/citrate symporter
MIGDSIDALRRSFEDLSLNTITFIIFGVGILLLLDYITGFSFHYRLQSKIEALESLQNLRGQGLEDQEQLQSLYDSILNDIRERQKPLFPNAIPLLNEIPLWLVKAISATYVFIVATPFLVVSNFLSEQTGT